LQELGLNACIECGCCDYVCPSQIQLTSRYIAAKAELAQNSVDARRAEHAKQRYTAHQARLTAQRETESTALEQQATTAENTDSIEAIMERARDKEQRE
jgi:electron transport complex protein RnfC